MTGSPGPSPSNLDAIVIGGGHSGLATSRHLARRGIDHVVLERGRIGETWRGQRWDSFTLNTPGSMNRLPGDLPAGAPDAGPDDGFQPRDSWVARLDRYAVAHGLPVRQGVEVTSVRATRDRFVVDVRSPDDAPGAPERLFARVVVVASGSQTVPLVPGFATGLPDSVDSLTAAEYRRPAALRPGAVLVVGSAQSGVQVAEDLLDAEREVFLCTSAVPRVPRRYRGRDVFEWLDGLGWWDQTADRLPDPGMLTARNPMVSGVGRYGHTVSLQALAARGVHLLGRPRAAEHGRLLLDDTVGANIALGDRSSAEVKARIDAAIRDRGTVAPAPDHDPADAPHPDPASVRSPAELDLDHAGIGTVIFATGYTGRLDYLPPAWLEADGQPRHARGVGVVPGIVFVGWRWMITRRSSLIYAADQDGGLAADVVARHLVDGGCR